MDPVEVIALEEGQEDGDQVEEVAVVVVMGGGNGRDGLLILHVEVEDVVVDLLAMEEEAVEVMGQAVEEVAREFLNNNAELFKSNSVNLCQDKNVELFRNNNVKLYQDNNAEMYQDKNAQQFQGKNVLNNANPLPGAKCAAKSVTYLLQLNVKSTYIA